MYLAGINRFRIAVGSPPQELTLASVANGGEIRTTAFRNHDAFAVEMQHC
jgi:hypothetical protein